MSDMQYPAGWYDDPMGRADQRYYDGAAWTEQIRIGNVSQTDPLESAARPESVAAYDDPQEDVTVAGAGSAGGIDAGINDMTQPVPPDAQGTFGADVPVGLQGDPVAHMASGAAAAPAETTGSDKAFSFLDSLGDVAKRRESADLPLALGGVGGGLVGFGLVALIGQSGSRGAILGGALAAVVVALLAAFKFLGEQPWLRTAATACAAVGLFALAGGLILAGEIGDKSPALFLLLAGVLHLVAWVAPGFRGRPFMLGGGLVATSFGLALLVAGGRCEGDSFGGGGCNFAEEAASEVGLSTGAGAVMLAIGVALLFAVRKLDAQDYRGIAETTAAAAIITLIFGALAFSIDLGSTANSFFVIVIGLGLGIVGHQGARRALTWTGAVMVAAGVVSLVSNLVTTNDATTGAIVVILLGVGLIAVPRFVQLQAANRDQESMPATASS